MCAFCLLVSLGNLQAQSKNCSATCTKTAKTAKADVGHSAPILVLQNPEVNTKSCNPKNCDISSCKPANCKPANCNPANCKKGGLGVKASMTQNNSATSSPAKPACQAKASKVALAEAEL